MSRAGGTHPFAMEVLVEQVMADCNQKTSKNKRDYLRIKVQRALPASASATSLPGDDAIFLRSQIVSVHRRRTFLVINDGSGADRGG